MQLYHFATLAAIVIQLAGASKAKSSKLNGWYACADNTFSDAGSSGGVSAECAIYTAPLCYPGICKTPQFADPTVNIFVKRMTATKGDVKTASNVWLLQGGPGDGSTGLEATMVALHAELEGAVNVYTMDHRGTGRSTFLDCVAAQATTTGSPDGMIVKPSEVPACAQALENEYGDLASFSTTSAATDVVTFISKFTNGASTTVYGCSYGTVFVERIMHLNPPEVTGYVLDGVATTSGAAADKFYYISEWDASFGEVGDHFLSLCGKDPSCAVHFKKPKTLQKTLQSVLNSFDKHPNSTCANIIRQLSVSLPDPTPSTILRTMFGNMLMDQEQRKFIPPVVLRLSRCDDNDVEVLT
ncbi:Serine protease family S33, partial [Phytophthora palmivora]